MLKEGDVIEAVVIPQTKDYSFVYQDVNGDLVLLGVLQHDQWSWLQNQIPTNVLTTQVCVFYAFENEIYLFAKKYLEPVPNVVKDWWTSLSDDEKVSYYLKRELI